MKEMRLQSNVPISISDKCPEVVIRDKPGQIRKMSDTILYNVSCM